MNCQWELAKMTADRDAAQRVVAEFRGALADIADSVQRRASDALVSHGNNQFCLRVDLDAAIARAEVSDAAARTLGADFTRVLRECGDAIARAEKAEARAEEAEARIQRTEAVTNGALDAVIARLDSFESNVVAQAERLRLADDLATAARGVLAGADPVYGLADALTAWDAVPGDDKEQP